MEKKIIPNALLSIAFLIIGALSVTVAASAPGANPLIYLLLLTVAGVSTLCAIHHYDNTITSLLEKDHHDSM